ncbi:MAG: tape measure protein [Clostridia bacterium]
MPNNITELKVGIGADLSQLAADLKRAEAEIAKLGSKPIKLTVSSAIKQQTAAIKQAAQQQRQAQQQQAAAQRQQAAAQRQAAREQAAYERSIDQMRSMSMSSYQKSQERITTILQKQLDYVNKRIAAEQASASSNKQTVAALQLEKATLKTTAHSARLSVYAKDVAAYIRKAKGSMSGMQGYARSTANIFKGIILSQAFYKGVNAVKGMVADAWELSVALNTAEATFSGMFAGGQKEAQGLLEVLKQEAIRTPFDVSNLIDATRLLTAYGIQAKNLMYIMRAVEKATAVSGDPTRMERISRAIGQIYTKGKLTAKEVRQLTEAGVAVSDILAEELGLTQDELAKGWANLNIEANKAINAIVRGIDKRYGQALDNMEKTTQQKINNMRESFELVSSSIMDPIRRAVDSVIDTIMPKVERMYQAIQAVGLGKALKTLLPPGVFDGAVSAINAVVKAAQVIGIVFNQIKPIISAVLGSLAWYGRVLFGVFTSVAAAFGMFGKSVGASVSGVATLELWLKRVLGALLAYKAAMFVVGAVSRIWGFVAIAIKGVHLAIGGAIAYTQLLAATMKAAGASGALGFLPVIGVLLIVVGLVIALAGKFNDVKEAVKRVGAALKDMGGGTSIGEKFKEIDDNIQESIDKYNAEVKAQAEDYSHALIEEEKRQSDSADDAASATKKAMKGLMSFDEVYKLAEAAETGIGDLEELDFGDMPPIDMKGVFEGFGGLGDDFFKDLKLDELQGALGDLWAEINPMLSDIMLYGLKMVMYFKQMQLYSKAMTGESKEQLLHEKSQTKEDIEQKLQEKAQTQEDIEQKLQEKAQTQEDIEQKLQEKAQTQEDIEQLLQERSQTIEDKEQLLQEKMQTTEDKEQLLQEKMQTAEDKEQALLSKGGGGAGGGISGGGLEGKGTAAALGLLNVAQLVTDVKLISDDIKALKEDSSDASAWLSLFVNGLMAAVDALQLFAAGKILFGAGKGVAGKVGGKVAGKAASKAASAAPPVDLDSTTVDTLNQSTGQLNPKLSSLAKNLAMGLVILAEVAAAAILIVGAIWVLGKMLEQVGIAWEPVIENAGTVAISMGIGVAILAAIGAITAALGKAGASLVADIAIGIAVLALIGAAAALFLAEIWAIGKALDEIRIAWEPVLENGETVLLAIGLGTALLVAIGAICAVLGMVGTPLLASIAIGIAMLALIGVAAGLFLLEIWAIGKGLDEIRKAWEPVLEHGDTVLAAIGLGTALLVAVGAVCALLGVAAVASAGLLPLAIGLGIAMLLEVGVAVGLFILEIWAIGKGLEQIGIAWEPVLENGENIAKAIEIGTDLLIAIGAVTALLGAASIASVGLLPLAIGLGTALLVQLTEAFITFTQSLIKVAKELSDNLAPALARLNVKLPSLSRDMEDFVGFMKEFAGHVVTYTKVSAIAGLSGTIDTIIGWFTKDPVQKLADDIAKIEKQLIGLNDKLRLANPELRSAVRLLTDYGKLMGEMAEITKGNSNTTLPDKIFTNLQEAGKKLVTGFGDGIKKNTKSVKTAMEAVYKEVEKADGSTSKYKDKGKKIASSVADGIKSNTSTATSGFKSMLNNMLTLMEQFTGRIATGLNDMLSGFSKTMKSLSTSTSGSVSYSKMSGGKLSRLADGGIIQAARGVQMLRKPTMLASNVEAGEAGAEVVFPLENTPFIKAFANDIANAVSRVNMQTSAQNINIQMEQARAGVAQDKFNAPSAKEISDAIRSWFTPQMQSLHDVLEEDRTLEVTVPPTSNALWRAILSELKAVNASSGARGFSAIS